jgi:transcriptional regulator with XRE-family HTH domain
MDASITSDSQTIGDRVKIARRERAITQEELAERARVSPDIIRKLEQGQRTSAKISTLIKIANGLGITLSALLGRRERLDRSATEGILAVRDALLSVGDLPGFGADGDDEPTPLGELETMVHRGWGMYWDGRLADLAGLLPGLIAEARATREHAGAAAATALAQSYQLAADLMVHVGNDDLAMIAAERALAAAAQGDDELQHATLAGTASWVLLHQGRTADAEKVAAAAARQIEPMLSSATPEHLTVWGALLLTAAAPAATASKADEVATYIGLARSAAGQFGTDRHDYWVSFGPTQVAMQETYTSVVLGQSGRALKAAQGVRRENLLGISWGAHHLDKAQALADSRRGGEAVDALAEAHSVSPEWFRHQGLARSLVRELVERQRRLTPALRQLAGSVDVN